jgi:hypothetical protein
MRSRCSLKENSRCRKYFHFVGSKQACPTSAAADRQEYQMGALISRIAARRKFAVEQTRGSTREEYQTR